MDDETTIDIDTLEEVHRLLNSTEFASARDLADRGLVPVATSNRTSASRGGTVSLDAGADPLPRRR